MKKQIKAGVYNPPVFEKLGETEKLYRQNKELNTKLTKLVQELEEKKSFSNKQIVEIRQQQLEVARELASAQQFLNSAKEELEHYNPVHPFLDKKQAILAPAYVDALRYRLVTPELKWNDDENVGMLRMDFMKDGKPDTIAYAFSGKALEVHQSYIKDKLITELAKDIANKIAKHLDVTLFKD